MRTNQRNKRTIFYSLYLGISDEKDSEGNYTGEHPASYGRIVETRMNVSGGRGRADIELFGVDNPFTHTVVTDDLKTPFDTETIWWYGVDPLTEPHNLRCTGVSRTNNQVVIALADVNVTHGNHND